MSSERPLTDRELAAEIVRQMTNAARDNIAHLMVDGIADMIASHSAPLRVKLERLQRLVERSFQDGWMHGAACGNPNGGYATHDWEQSDSRLALREIVE